MLNHWFKLKPNYAGTETKAFLFKDNDHDAITSFQLGDIAALKAAVEYVITTNPTTFNRDGSLKPKLTRTTIVVEYDEAGVVPTVIIPPGARIISRHKSYQGSPPNDDPTW